MKIPYYHVDAFTSTPFAGNPAGVCVLEAWLPDETMLGIAAENNLSETAFLVEGEGHYDLRWFTPVTEVDLCGHATLASAHVVFTQLGHTSPVVRFESKSGTLRVAREEQILVLDFPARPGERCDAPAALVEGLGREPVETYRARDYMAVFGTQAEIEALAPDMALLKEVVSLGVIATAPGDEVDFVSRFFAPTVGIPEDPVTGSAHCTLIPYWSARLGKQVLHARQVSARGGELYCQDAGERVRIGGRAVTYLTGEIEL
ncbi:MAG: PhzF family phenazine biosynthesis protein [Anaerolineae bacterium]|jgi:predicted PhzF superfamily epimerase YddE/YHI9